MNSSSIHNSQNQYAIVDKNTNVKLLKLNLIIITDMNQEIFKIKLVKVFHLYVYIFFLKRISFYK